MRVAPASEVTGLANEYGPCYAVTWVVAVVHTAHKEQVAGADQHRRSHPGVQGQVVELCCDVFTSVGGKQTLGRSSV